MLLYAVAVAVEPAPEFGVAVGVDAAEHHAAAEQRSDELCFATVADVAAGCPFAVAAVAVDAINASATAVAAAM